jgi:site-specific recombinase XerD
MFSINFWLRYQNTRKGLTPISCRVKINKQVCDFATGLKIPAENWNLEKQRIKGYSKQTSLDNELLGNIYAQIQEIIIRNENITSKEVINRYIKKDLPLPFLHDVLQTYIDTVKREFDGTPKALSKGTLVKWQSLKNHLIDFNEKIPINEISEKFGNEFYTFLITVKHIGNDHSVRHAKSISTVVDWAVSQKIIPNNPIRLCELKRSRSKEIQCLENQHLKLISSWSLSGNLDLIRDLFLFICYTGFDYCDFAEFNPKTDIKNSLIDLNRGKNDNTRIVPLLPEAKRILEKYQYDLPQCSNQHFNRTLKTFGQWLNLDFALTTKTGRKTAGSYLLNNNVPIEVVQAFLGHSSVKTTQMYYAKMFPDTVLRGLSHLM